MHSLPPLPYALDALEPWCDSTTLELHHDKHHKAYVDGANAAEEELASVDPGDAHRVSALTEALTFNLGGHVLHSLFWENLSPEPVQPPIGVSEALDASFGSRARFEDLFVTTCVGVKGSGWGALVRNPDGGGLRIAAIHDHHMGTVPTADVMAVVDVWEHAYYLTHRNKREQWVEEAVRHLDWLCVAGRLGFAE